MKHVDVDDSEYYKLLQKQTYYHGTSTNVKIPSGILKPSNETGNIREQNLRYVYITTSLNSAKRYAYKAVEKFGGDPIIYVVEPDFDTLANRISCEFICSFAKILSEV